MALCGPSWSVVTVAVLTMFPVVVPVELPPVEPLPDDPPLLPDVEPVPVPQEPLSRLVSRLPRLLKMPLRLVPLVL